MDIKPIKTDADYQVALKEIESLMMATPETPEGEKLDVMVTLIEAYEAKHFPMDLPDPVEAIKFEMERKGLTVKDLEPMIGKSNRVYEILNRKRSLTLKMIWKLHQGLGIPAESLIKPPQVHAWQNGRKAVLHRFCSHNGERQGWCVLVQTWSGSYPFFTSNPFLGLDGVDEENQTNKTLPFLQHTFNTRFEWL